MSNNLRITKVTGYSEAAVRYTIDIVTVGSAPPDFEGTMDAMMDALELHYQKAKDYDGDENEFGMRGEIIGITRKVRKLKRILWDGKDPLFEGSQEILMDLIGSAALTLRMQKKVSDKYRAKWRVNPNKPDFPPFVLGLEVPTHLTGPPSTQKPPFPDGHDIEDEEDDDFEDEEDENDENPFR